MMFYNKKWKYDGDSGLLVESDNYKNGNIAYNIILVQPSNKPKNARYVKRVYEEHSGSMIYYAIINIDGDLMPLKSSKGEHLVMQTFDEYGTVIEEVFMGNVWTGLFFKRMIITKVNHYTSDGLFLKAESYIDPSLIL